MSEIAFNCCSCWPYGPMPPRLHVEFSTPSGACIDGLGVELERHEWTYGRCHAYAWTFEGIESGCQLTVEVTCRSCCNPREQGLDIYVFEQNWTCAGCSELKAMSGNPPTLTADIVMWIVGDPHPPVYDLHAIVTLIE